MLHYETAKPGDRVVAYPAPPAPPRPDDARVDLRELLQVLRRRRLSIFLTALIPVLAALAYSFLATPLYTANTQILIDPRDRRIVNNEVNPEGLAPDGGVAVVESQLLVIVSDNVLRQVIGREKLESDPEFGGEFTAPLAVLARRALTAVGLGPTSADYTRPELKALRQLKRRVGVKRADKAFVVDIFVTAESRDKSVRIADAIAQAYLDDQAKARAAAARQASTELTGRLDDLRRKVREAEDRVADYKQRHNILAAGGVLINEQQLSEMNIELKNARARTEEARSRYEQIERARRDGAASGATQEAVQSQTVGLLRSQYAEVARQRADAINRLGPRHPTVSTLNAQLRDLQRLINDELGRIAVAAKSDFERAQASEQAIARSLEALKRDAVSTNEALIRLRELEREVEANRAVYEAFLVRAGETREQQSIDSTNARVISTASLPRDKSWPPRSLLIAIALVGGLGIGVGVGLMREYLDETIHTRQQLFDLTGLPVLATLPPPELSAAHARRLFNGGTDPNATADTRSRASDPFAAAVARLYGALFADQKPSGSRSLLVTSSASGEGKTTVALHLALEAAASGARVMLIDADFERGRLSQLLNTSGNAGLADLIERRAALASVLLRDERTGLNFLPLGQVTRADTARPKSEDIAQKLVRQASEFDLAIVDCGSLLADPYVRPFAETADDILFVTRAGSTRRDDITAALELLRINLRKVRGAVLTATSTRTG